MNQKDIVRKPEPLFPIVQFPTTKEYLFQVIRIYDTPADYCKISSDGTHLIMDNNFDWELKDGKLYAYKKES